MRSKKHGWEIVVAITTLAILNLVSIFVLITEHGVEERALREEIVAKEEQRVTEQRRGDVYLDIAMRRDEALKKAEKDLKAYHRRNLNLVFDLERCRAYKK